MRKLQFQNQPVDPVALEAAARAALTGPAAIHYQHGKRRGWTEAFFTLPELPAAAPGHLASQRPDGRLYVHLNDSGRLVQIA